MDTYDDSKNDANPQESWVDSSVERIGSLTNEPAENQTKDKKVTSKLANLLEGIKFPAKKEEILDHINRKSPQMGNRTNDVFESINNNLEEGIEYKNVYEIGLAAQVVEKK
ncbi:hypothetical protein [Candidatus Nitrosocosmicus arcticus]|uniref:DUF2795 domain-containing protein n=1 Tax=Candidatus Nitrosocosmicus arcticus TaxID=2035267 RepID=A0A557SVP2_9ARCH|nr:hypothetical protein [Candidatus Nitrosocosmicus arcticus]TVP40678.1 hypothetical protein NARC_60065 [Candidatus Nitrosocosmicus arcticus]